jgi:hypothetical protein
MKKNKLHVFIVLLTVVLIFGAAASCPECENQKITSNSDKITYPTAADTTKPDPNLIHGVLPTKVIGHATGNKTKDEGTLEFWNVGRIGGEQYSKATYIITRNGKTIKTYEGYFAGGPNGEMHLTSSDGKDIHGQLEGGMEFVSDDGSAINIDNSDAFDGWTDAAEEDDTESTEPEETTTETVATNTETVANLIHGVVPTKVTGTSAGSGKSGYIGILDFWNVGKLGGEQYSKATYIMTLDGKTTSTWEGYFTGGPNGEFFLSGKDGELHGKLVDGKQLVGDSNGIADIDNPEAFNGWID